MNTVGYLITELKKESEKLGVDLINTPLSSIGTVQNSGPDGPSEFGYNFHFIKDRKPIDVTIITIEKDNGIDEIEAEEMEY